MNQLIYPQLDNVKIGKDGNLPYSLLEAIKRAFDYIQQLTSAKTAGVLEYAQNAIPATGQPNQKIYVSDYKHFLQWDADAAKWTFAPEDDGSDYFRECASTPPSNKLWHACNGGTVNYLQSDGSVGSRILPNPAGAALYAKLGAAYAQATVAAQVPTIAGTTASGTANISNNNNGTGATIGGVAVAASPHSHTDSGHTHGVGSLANTLPGDPVAHCTVVYFYRQ